MDDIFLKNILMNLNDSNYGLFLELKMKTVSLIMSQVNKMEMLKIQMMQIHTIKND